MVALDCPGFANHSSAHALCAWQAISTGLLVDTQMTPNFTGCGLVCDVERLPTD